MNDVLFLAGILVLIAVLGWPRHGLWHRWREARRLAARALQEDTLKHILKYEANNQDASVLSVAGALRVRDSAAAALLRRLETAALVSFEGGRLRLTAAGRDLAVQVVRAHRLWESYLAEQTGFAEARWHRLAERQEHLLSPQQTEALAARLGHPLVDPHGDAIPERGGQLSADVGQPVNAMPLNQPFTIVHLEDEPDESYRELLALGLRPGMHGFVTSRAADKLQLFADGRHYELPPSLAQNISTTRLDGVTSGQMREAQYLADLPEGQRARVVGLTGGCRGAERRRLLDLGFVPGSVVEASLASPAGDPMAYLVRGALIALRREQARLVRVEATVAPLQEVAA